MKRVSGHPRPPSVEALVYRGCPCQNPPVSHRVQDDCACGWCVSCHLVSACERVCELVLCDGVPHCKTVILQTNCDSCALWNVGTLTSFSIHTLCFFISTHLFLMSRDADDTGSVTENSWSQCPTSHCHQSSYYNQMEVLCGFFMGGSPADAQLLLHVTRDLNALLYSQVSEESRESDAKLLHRWQSRCKAAALYLP